MRSNLEKFEIGSCTFSGSIGNNKRRSSEAFHFWTIKRGLVIKSTRPHVGQVIGYTDRIRVRGKFPGRSIALFFFFLFFPLVTLPQRNSFRPNSFANFQIFFSKFYLKKKKKKKKKEREKTWRRKNYQKEQRRKANGKAAWKYSLFFFFFFFLFFRVQVKQ